MKDKYGRTLHQIGRKTNKNAKGEVVGFTPVYSHKTIEQCKEEAVPMIVPIPLNSPMDVTQTKQDDDKA